MNIRVAYINSLDEEVKKFRASVRRAPALSPCGRKARGIGRHFAVTLPDMENGSWLQNRVEMDAQRRAAPARVGIATSKAKKQSLI
ncbi:hypothetical protein [Burkholderia sp. Ac-20365]|uniref:hypothetical protein n=1 Tax=Burkholderia sp. Ac-20365 TaxID=2703897 RepID=UPI00197BC97B|nr:hypothetical protein [Burkholderia sp. Ac-20365]MBN3767535.1 hypothetical protein [Burkholderia sp. Ac-20365]